MSASPFRSHLLQQWARTNQKRPPIAAAPWLKPSSASGRSDNNNLDADDSTMNHHHGGARRRNHHHTKGNSSSSNGPPSLSTIDSNSNANSLASSWSESHHHRRHKPSPTSGKQASILMTREFSSLTSLPSSSGSPSASSSSKGSNISDTSNSSALASSIAFSTCASNDASAEEDDYDEVAEFLQPPLEAIPMQSLMLTRRTETEQSVFSKKNSKTLEELSLMSAVDRAVKCAQMAPNHKRTEPFSFSRFGFGSQTAHELAEIAYNVTLTDTQNEPNAEGKRWRWLHIPVFLVASVHNNQSPIEISDSTDYDPLPFHPPQTERQLEDYASACAAVQNILLSLHSEGIGSKWATGPVINTRAFRELINAQPADRIAALIMVGGATAFQNEGEERESDAQPARRRSIHGDLLTDLP